VQFRLGLAEFEAKEYSRAAVAFTQVLEESVSVEMGSASRYNLALCQKLLGQTDEARASLERYRTERPHDSRTADVSYQLGDMDDAKGNTKEAAQNFELALAAGPSAALEVELRGRERGGLLVDARATSQSERDHGPEPGEIGIGRHDHFLDAADRLVVRPVIGEQVREAAVDAHGSQAGWSPGQRYQC
jgi:tetratricopeptide (TPR) repeat protein